MNAIANSIGAAIWSRVMAEPAVAQGLLQAAIALGCAFGLNLSGQQIAAILTFTAVVLSFLTRRVVTPNAALKANP